MRQIYKVIVDERIHQWCPFEILIIVNLQYNRVNFRNWYFGKKYI